MSKIPFEKAVKELCKLEVGERVKPPICALVNNILGD